MRSLPFSGLFCSATAYCTQACVNRAMMFHELRAAAYITIRMVNDGELGRMITGSYRELVVAVKESGK